MNTISVNQDELVKLLVERCPRYSLTIEGTPYCEKKFRETCRLSLCERERCPRDCPHMNETTSWRCDAEKCRVIKKILKQLKA